jgi:subtilisin family serine protease
LAQIPKDVLLFRLSDEQEFNTNPSQDYWTRFLEVVEKNSSFMADQWIVDLREELFDCYLDSVTGRKVRVNEEGKSLAYFVQEILSSIGVSSNPDSIWHEANVGFSIKLTQIQVDRLKQIPVVRGVYRDIVFSATTDQHPHPLIGLSWGLDRIDEHNPSTEDVYRYHYDGTGVQVYVFDTGLQTSHQEFNQIGQVRTFTNDGTQDNYGHGTAVAAIIGGELAGVAKDVTIHSYKVLNDAGQGTATMLINGINEVALHHQQGIPAVANFSLSGQYDTAYDMLDTALGNLFQDGVLLIASAGNDTMSLPWDLLPAASLSVVAVGSTNSDDSFASQYSNYGGLVDLYAPGTGILSALNLGNSLYTTYTGTSFSSPIVAGIAARLWEEHSGYSPSEIWDLLVARSITGKISALPLGSNDNLANLFEWWYPFHTFTEWQSSDYPPSSSSWFYFDQLSSWLWANSSYYPWFFRDADAVWLLFQSSDNGLLSFYNATTAQVETYPYGD